FIIIHKATSNLTTNISSTISLHWNDTIFINITLRDIFNNEPILNANNNLTGNLTIFGFNSKYLTEVGNGVYIFKLYMNKSEIPELTHSGLWKLNISLIHNNYTYSETILSFILISHTEIITYNRTFQISLREYTYENEILKIWIRYLDSDFNMNITNTSSVIWTNWTKNVNITFDSLQNLYLLEFDTIGINAGKYKINISISATNYDPAWSIINITIWTKNTTKLYFLIVPPSTIDAGETFTIKIQLNQTDVVPEVPLKGQVIKLYVNGEFLDQQITDENGTVEFKDIIAFERYSKTGMILTIVFEGNYTKLQYTITSEKITVRSGGIIENYWWVFLIIIIVVGIVVVSGYIIKKYREKEQIEMKKVMTSFNDVINIQYLIVIHKGMGADIFQYSMGVEVDPTLLAGFIQAVKQFSSELTRKEEGKGGAV
ncbi:MAG: hypothetical protein ACTSPQ_11675, partial [Candidatus Helarchaeota archaeon]